MRSENRKNIQLSRSLGQSLFATLTVVLALAMLTHTGESGGHFTAGPLDDTLQYLLDLWHMIIG
ncbi:MAG: hypothetical protein H6810_00825 [Phycisphaeraceae bacterium]|nr:MAG: hypothetical protein H6810_00825 [Phycisphaeraceae bacterium]